MPAKRTIEEEINSFLETWDYKQQVDFVKDILPLVELYNVDEQDDWVQKEVGGDSENVRTIRLIRTVYLVSRIAEFHAGMLCSLNMKFKDLWKRMQKEGTVAQV